MNSPPHRGGFFNSGMIVRRASIADVEAVMELAKEIPMAAQWSYGQYETNFAVVQQTDTRAQALFVACASERHDTISGREKIVGFAAFSAIPHVGGGECELENMAVAESWRRRGIALRMLAAGLLWCRAWCPADPHDAPPNYGLSLEVRSSNVSAIAFYGLAGFKENGRRPAYYRQPDDDAILMWKSLNSLFETR